MTKESAYNQPPAIEVAPAWHPIWHRACGFGPHFGIRLSNRRIFLALMLGGDCLRFGILVPFAVPADGRTDLEQR
jgi:hypothetical protein